MISHFTAPFLIAKHTTKKSSVPFLVAMHP